VVLPHQNDHAHVYDYDDDHHQRVEFNKLINYNKIGTKNTKKDS
jgi:hypothetical protein